MSVKPKKDTENSKAGKKPYQPPQIISREQLESVAAACSAPGSKGLGGPSNANEDIDCGADGSPLNS